MFELSGIAEIRCSKCLSSFNVDGSDIFVDAIGSDERNMGPETFYHGRSAFICPRCRNHIEIEYQASEYPMGALNDSDIEVSGAELLGGFHDIDISFQEEMYSFDEQVQVFLPKKNEIITSLTLGVSDLISAISARPEMLYQIDPRQFEELIANIFSRHNFHVELTPQTRDGGRDIIAIRSDLNIKSKYIIECKRYAMHRPVRVDLVRSLHGVQHQEGANKSIVATTSYFTAEAKEFASATNTTLWGMDLKGYEDIVKWVRDVSRNQK